MAQERVRNSRGKRPIGVRAIEVSAYIRKLNLTIVASIYRHLKVKNQTKMTEKGKHNPLLAGLIVLVACFFAVACAINYMSLNPGNSGGKKMDNNCDFYDPFNSISVASS